MRNGFEPDGLGGWVWEGEVARQLGIAGVLPYLVPVEVTSHVVRAHVRPEYLAGMIVALSRDQRFASGGLHLLHPDVGTDRRDFRAYKGELGRGSLQIVVDATTGKFYADIDGWNPYQDVVNWIGHAGEVLAGWWRRWRA